MIKRILSIAMIMTILLLSVSIVFADEKQSGTSTVDNAKMIEYLNSDSKKRLLLRENYGYMTCIEKFNSDVTFLYLLNMSDLFINSGTKPDKNKYMEVLINIIASYDFDSADDISKQKEMDNLKSFKDYALDCAEMGAQAVSVMTGVSSSTTQLEEGISTAVDGLSVLSNNTDNWIEALTNLETIVQDYSAHSDFLELVSQKTEDSDLKDAAKTLKGSLSKAIKIKLETYSNITNENFQNYEEFFFSDGLFAAIKQTPDYASDESLKFFTECGEKVFVLKDAWDLGVSIGKMVGNVVAGGEDLINRVLEMMALHDISDILVNGLFETESKVVSNIYNNNSNEITNYINLSQYLIMTRIRGEYCLYSIVAKDAGLLSWFNKKSQEDAKSWYDNKAKKLSDIQKELLSVNDYQDSQTNTDISSDNNSSSNTTTTTNETHIEHDLMNYYGTDLMQFVNMIGDMHDVGATDGTKEYSNGTIIVSTSPFSNGIIDFVSLREESDYNINGIEIGMSMEEVMRKLSDATIKSNLDHYKLFHLDSQKSLSVYGENGKVESISLMTQM